MELSPMARLYPVTNELTNTLAGSPLFVGKLLLVLSVMALIALVAISAYQRRRAVDRTRVELFDRRFAIYESARHFCHAVSSTGTVEPGLLHEFRHRISQARWLLDIEVHDYLHERLYTAAVKLNHLAEASAGLPGGLPRDENAYRQTQVRTWFHEQAHLLDRHFAPFLQVERNRSESRLLPAR
jgi:hypothetical protein